MRKIKYNEVPKVKRSAKTKALLFLMIAVNLVPQARAGDRREKIRAAAAVIDRIFRDHAVARRLPGLAYGVVLDGELVLAGGLGYSQVEQGIAADEKTLFRAASMSKSITALAILQLRDGGLLRLDDPAALYLPEMQGVIGPSVDGPAITLRHLLTHGAGFPEDNPWGDRQLARTDAELLSLIPGISFANTPGVAYGYSNLGFAILGQIVQKVSGMDFRQYTSEKIFKPLGMDATVWEYTEAPPVQLAHGYTPAGDDVVEVPLEHHGAYGAMGGLITSVADFARYAALHLAAWPPRDDPEDGPLRRSSLREMHHPWRFYTLAADNHRTDGSPCPAVQAYAYGLRWQSDCDGRITVGHSGGLPGFGSNWTMMPEYGLAVISFDNLTYATTSGVNRAVLDTLIVLAGLSPHQPPVSAVLEQRKQELVRMLPDWREAEKAGIFAENFFLDTPLPERVKESRWLFAEAGPIIRTGALQPEDHLRGTFLLEGSKKNIRLFFTLSPEKEPRIQELRMNLVEKKDN
jgi:CubicO group peptidase (beta-lactamase class C family)